MNVTHEATPTPNQALQANRLLMTRFTKRILIGVVSLFVVGLVCVATFRLLPDRLVYAREFRDAQDVLGRIEAYRRDHGRLPSTLAEVGRSDDEQGPIYYHLHSAGRYVVSFQAPRYGFFGMLSYDSTTHSWVASL